jgi:hypothetical protein
MPRTLLPVFKAPPATKEPLEDFSWIKHDKEDYELAKLALDTTPGSRDYLKNYTFNKYVSSMPFSDPVGFSLLSNFGDHHSGSSVTILAWSYKAALNNWDSFVYKTKEAYALNDYNRTQLTEADLLTYRTPDALRAAFNLTYNNVEITQMVDDLKDEIQKNKEAKKIREKKEYLDARIDILIHHYEHPNRWFDSVNGSSLFGSPENITHEMLEHMTQLYPDYLSHVIKVNDAYKAHVSYLRYRNNVSRSEALALQDHMIELKYKIFESPNITEQQIADRLLKDPYYADIIKRVIETRGKWSSVPLSLTGLYNSDPYEGHY